MKILALDLGKYKTVGCDYESGSGIHQFKRGFTTPAGLTRMVQEAKPDRVVIEICSIAGWVCDLMWEMGIEVQVANTSEDAWRWRKVKQKDDRRDALKAARLSAVNQIREVYIPGRAVRQWRALITYRQQLVRRRTKIKNHIRVALLDQPQRFRKASQVSGYIGMVPKALDSGETERRGHITRQGSRLVRSLLVEVAWAGLRHNAWVRQTYQRLSGGKKARKKIAIVAVGRKLLVRCWAMLRDNRAWDWQPQIT